MSKYNIHIDKPTPDEQQIVRHKNFPALYSRYRSITRFAFWKNLYRNPRSFATVVAIGAIIYLVFQAVDEERMYENGLKPPFEEKVPAFQIVEFDPSDSSLILPNTPFSLRIDPGTLVDLRRRPVEDKIEIHYRALNRPSDYLLAGIPMEYDSAGEQYPLVSEAMLELRAYRGKKPLLIREDRNIRLLVSSSDSSFKTLNVYEWKADQLEWQWKGLDDIREAGAKEIPPKPEFTYEGDNGGVKSLEQLDFKPAKPFRLPRLDNLKKYPELARQKDLWWSYIGDPSKSPEEKNVWKYRWQNILIRPGKEDGVYEMLLRMRKSGRVIRYQMRARLLNVDRRSEAMNWYRNELRKYKQLKSEQDEMQTKDTAYAAAYAAYQEELKDWEQRFGANMDQQQFFRTFKIARLGLYCLGESYRERLAYFPVSIDSEKGLKDNNKLFVAHSGFGSLLPVLPGVSGGYMVPWLGKEGSIWSVLDKNSLGVYKTQSKKLPENLELQILRADTLGIDLLNERLMP